METLGTGEKGGFVEREEWVVKGGGVGVGEECDGELVGGLGECDEEIDFEGVESGEGVEPDLGAGAGERGMGDGEGGDLQDGFEIGGAALGGLESGGPGGEQEGEVVEFAGGDRVGIGGGEELVEGVGGVALLSEFAEGGVEFLEEAWAVGDGGEGAELGAVVADDFLEQDEAGEVGH